jgi:dTDP-4-amino-4,6-dideoxygalactose transaminase
MIKNWDYLDAYGKDREKILELVDRIFSSGRLILGPRVAEFEKNFSSFCGSAYGIGVNSGTDALFLALKALGIGAGDEVVTVSNTAVPTVAAIRATGAVPVFVDVEEDTFLMDMEKLESVLSAGTKCILPVHLFGQMADMDPLLAIASPRGLPVVEDCAQATGAVYRGKKAGSFGDLAGFSFYPTKVLGGFGDGGMVLTQSKEYHDKLKRLRFYGMDQAYYSEEEGYNSRLDEVHAALLDFKLQSLEESVKRRREIASVYSRELASIGDIILPATKAHRSHQFYVYTIRTRYRDRLVEHLLQHDMEARINYPTPVHLMRGYRFLGYHEGDLPVTERLAREIVSLPLYPELSLETVAEIAGSIRSFFKQH